MDCSCLFHAPADNRPTPASAPFVTQKRKRLGGERGRRSRPHRLDVRRGASAFGVICACEHLKTARFTQEWPRRLWPLGVAETANASPGGARRACTTWSPAGGIRGDDLSCAWRRYILRQLKPLH